MAASRVDPVGLLALQGDFARHRRVLVALDCPTRLVRRPGDLAACSSLIIPGGESTTLARLIDRSSLREPLRAFAADHPVMGTCAGLILLANRLVGEADQRHGVTPLGLIDCRVERNGYGRQIDSFTADVSIAELDGSRGPFPAVFIRAPRITDLGPAVEVFARHGDEPVAVRQGHLLGVAFHPELSDDSRIHAAFLSLIPDRS